MSLPVICNDLAMGVLPVILAICGQTRFGSISGTASASMRGFSSNPTRGIAPFRDRVTRLVRMHRDPRRRSIVSARLHGVGVVETLVVAVE